MSEDHDREEERVPDVWLSPWEQESCDEWEAEAMNMDDRLSLENETSAQKLWHSFQNSATAISKLYKERYQDRGVSLWIPFQNSASSLTAMYKDSLEASKRSFDHGVQCGGVRRTKDILAWARKRRRHIRREDLIAYLCGKSPPPRSKPPHTGARLAHDMSSPKHHYGNQPGTVQTPEEPDLQPFRDALALQGLNGSMANISVGYNKPDDPDAQTYSDSDFNCYILEELSRRCEGRKRLPPTDMRHDSPSRKRNRLL